jgi:hypothetical protein
MEKGAYIINQNPDDKYDIVFSVKPEVTLVPDNQQKLQLEIEKTLMVVRKLFANDEPELQKYFSQLLTLAQAGMVPENAQPAISLAALLQLKSEIIDKKSAEVKNTYFKVLGIQAIKIGFLPLIAALSIKLLHYYYPSVDALKGLSEFANFLFLWCGCMLGVWISFGTRKTVLTFEELTTIEEDRLEPTMRLLFIGAIAMFFSLLFYKKAISFNFGSISSSDINKDAFVAMIFGVALGLGEQIIGRNLTKKVNSIFEKF